MDLSIVTATYNAAATLRHCLDSIGGQSLRAEHLIIDGGSTDATMEILARLTPHALLEPLANPTTVSTTP
jgi:glycosyltransferase involved in cell wall biosynthesis